MRYNTRKPSGRISQALARLRQFEKMPNCEVEMTTIREWDAERGVLLACFAGADYIIKRGLKVGPRAATNRGMNVYEDILDDARLGDISDVFNKMGLDMEVGIMFDRWITPYEENRVRFFKDMEKLADDLREAGY